MLRMLKSMPLTFFIVYTNVSRISFDWMIEPSGNGAGHRDAKASSRVLSREVPYGNPRSTDR